MAIESVVVADDEFLNRDLLEEIFARMKISVRVAKDGVQALKLLEDTSADLLITDIRMPGMGGMKLLDKARVKWPEMPVVMMTAFASVESAVEAMRQGAYDYLMKPFGIEQVESLLLRLNERQQLQREVRVLREEVRDRHQVRNMLGSNPVMMDIMGTIDRAAKSNATVLVRGESGTGKELVARALHEQSERASGPFIKVNCAALTETLLASELFGHERGSFTGADKQHIGRFELAHGGTLLLDEISEICPELQAKMLRVLEEREFERVGGDKSIQVDVRIVATTNRDLIHEVEQGNFREDLYYRLNVIPVDLPSLRERSEDILPIFKHYLKQFSKELSCKAKLSKDAEKLLLSYGWPGNVRELVNVAERLVVLHGDKTIKADVLIRSLPEIKKPLIQNLHYEESAHRTLDDLEKEHIISTLKACADNKQKAADELGISVRTLWNRLSRYEKVS
ncbi:MAG: sigma-54-dependent Fis family transcriptional regulator [Planctomycetes bacterium]|nr:sigma-54-dependent Fis family transcriptional regulator [Planctomycetota bacterium]